MNEKRKGIWIPMELMNDKQLNWPNKVLLSEILSLHELPNGCIASNDHFGELLGIDRSAASKRISKLKKLGYIETKDVYDRNSCIGRIITPIINVQKNELPESKNEERKDPIKQDDEKVNSDAGKADVESPNCQLDSLGGSSQTTIGVVPERLGGSSHGNTINTSINSGIKDPLLIQYTGETASFNSVDDLIILEKEIPTNLTSSDSFASTGNNPALPKISTKEFRSIMNDFFEGYPSWEADMYALGLDEFVRRTPYFHSNKEEYIGMIREFNEL